MKIVKMIISIILLILVSIVILLKVFGERLLTSSWDEQILNHHGLTFRVEMQGTFSDPFYARGYVENDLFFQCRGADSVSLSVRNDTLILTTNGNLSYDYDKIQKNEIKSVPILYENYEVKDEMN